MATEKMQIYNAVREVPQQAKKPIIGGRMNGKTDINPMWRIRALTEQFGACGIGWYYEITNKWLEAGANGEVAAFVEINLYIKSEEGWSKPIVGIGGNSFIAKERSGLYTSDECYKMALTDALSVACKALGVGADVYWDSDPTKYSAKAAEKAEKAETKQKAAPAVVTETTADKSYNCVDCGKPFKSFTDKNGKEWSAGQAYHLAESYNTDGKARCSECMKKAGTRKVKENG